MAENKTHNKTLIQWQAPEFIPHYRSTRWFTIAAILAIGLITYAIFTEAATLAIAVVIMAGAYYYANNKLPKVMNIKIKELGIDINGKFYPYNHVNSFWIVYDPDFVRSLYLRISGKETRIIRLEIGEEDPVHIRKTLSKEVPEIEGATENIIDTLVRILRLQ